MDSMMEYAAAAGGNTEATEFEEDLTLVVMCPLCKNYPPNLIEEYSDGDVVCADCGCVVGDRIIDTRSEWRTFANDGEGGDDPSRVGDATNPFLEGSQLETNIAFSESRAHKQLARLQNQSTQNAGSKALQQAYGEISSLAEKATLGNNVTTTAKYIYKHLHGVGFLKGKAQDTVVAGCIFIAARQRGSHRTFKDVAAAAGIDKKDLGRMYKQLDKILKNAQKNKKRMDDPSAIDAYEGAGNAGADVLVAQYCSKIGFKQFMKVENIAKSLAEKSSTVTELAGRSPLSLAAACIYMACHIIGEPKPCKDIAFVANVSDGTVKTAYKFLYQSRQLLTDPEWFETFATSIDGLPLS